MAWLMVGAALLSAVALPKLKVVELPASVAQRDLLGFVAVLVAVAVGVFVSQPASAGDRAGAARAGAGRRQPAGGAAGQVGRPARAAAGHCADLAVAAWAARAARFETCSAA